MRRLANWQQYHLQKKKAARADSQRAATIAPRVQVHGLPLKKLGVVQVVIRQAETIALQVRMQSMLFQRQGAARRDIQRAGPIA